MKHSLLPLGLFLLIASAAPEASAQRAPSGTSFERAVPASPLLQPTDVRLRTGPREYTDWPKSPAAKRAQLRQQMLQPTSAATRHTVPLPSKIYHSDRFSETVSQEEGSHTWWYVAGGAAVLGLATGAAVLLSGGGDGSGDGSDLPLPPERP